MTIKEAILKVLEQEKRPLNYKEVCELIIQKQLYKFEAKAPEMTVSAQLGEFIRNNDTRVKRVKVKNTYVYYLTKYENEISFENLDKSIDKHPIKTKKTFHERDLHPLLVSFLHNQNILSKTVYHEKSENKREDTQKWIHPDIIGVKFLKLKDKASYSLMKISNRADLYKLYSYELKKEISSDYELKKSYFQAVSNSSWANYGYLVAFDINYNLLDEMERLNEAFGIGVIELRANPFESKILFPAKQKNLDFKTIDKLCKANPDFQKFIDGVEKILSATEKYLSATETEFKMICDKPMETDNEILEYCKKHNIPLPEETQAE